MRRRVLLVIAAAVVVSLVAATASLAAEPSPQKYIPHKQAAKAPGAHVPLSQSQGTASLSPTARTGASLAPAMVVGPCTVTGHVLSYAGAAVEGAYVDLYYYDAGTGYYYYFDTAISAADGSFTFLSVPETADGELDVYTDEGVYWKNSLTITAAGPNDFTLQPGKVNVTLTDVYDDPSSNWNTYLPFQLLGTGGGGFTYLESASGQALAMPSDVNYGLVSPYMNSGIEIFRSPSIGVTAGVTNGLLNFSENNARDVYMLAPYWASGRPGLAPKIMFYNWPAGQHVLMTGAADAPTLAKKSYGTLTTDGATMLRSLTVPSTAPAGYTYWFTFTRTDEVNGVPSLLELYLPYQVATLSSSKSTIYRGSAHYLTGRVPIKGRIGSKTTGTPKTVTVYKRSSSAGVPTNWDATKNGWTRVGSYTTTKYGIYKTGYLRPSRSTWYVVRYAGDADYYAGYTSVIKVTVK